MNKQSSKQRKLIFFFVVVLVFLPAMACGGGGDDCKGCVHLTVNDNDGSRTERVEYTVREDK